MCRYIVSMKDFTSQHNLAEETLPLEEARLEALQGYGILDTGQEQDYDDLAALAAAICGVPLALITFVEEKTQWLKAGVGMPCLRTDRSASFCTHAIRQPALMVVPDTLCDARFADNPFVTGEPHVRFYAGMPLITPSGHALGTICVLDTQPRCLSTVQQNALKVLSRQTMNLLELRRTVCRMERNMAERAYTQAALRQSAVRLRESEARIQLICQAGGIGLWETDFSQRTTLCSESYAQLFGLELADFDGTTEMALSRVHPEDRKRLTEEGARAAETLSPLSLEIRALQPDGGVRWLLIKGEFSTDAAGHPAKISGSATDITARKLAEEALKQTEERFRTVVGGAPLVLFALDESGRFTMSEGKGLELLGMAPGQAVGQLARDLYADFPEVSRQIERAYAGEAFSARAVLGALTFETWYSPVHEADGKISSVIGVACDVTSRQQAEDALRSSEARFQAFMDNSPASAYVKDDQGRFLYVNDAFIRMQGYTEEQCLGRTAQEVCGEEVGADLHATTMEVMQEGHLVETLHELQRPDGSILHWLASRFTFYDAKGRRFLGCTGLDVSEQKRMESERLAAQQELENALSQLHATLESTTDGLLVVNTQGKKLCTNRRFYEMWRVPETVAQDHRDSVQIQFICDQLHNPEAFVANVLELYAQPQAESSDVLAFKDGRIFERYSRPLVISGICQGRVWSFRDVTQQEKSRQELIGARNHALASAQAKSEFLANMSHEIRTPMNGILGMTALLLGTPLLPKQQHWARTVQTSAESLLTVINDILDFSKIEAGKMTLEAVDFSPHRMLGEIQDLLAPRAAEKGLTLTTSLTADLPTHLRGDPARLRQILVNLAGNALKFTERGQVAIEASVVRETESHVEMRLSVRDSGIGIPPERQQAIFDSFTQADGSVTRRYGGTGLGLAICVRLTNLMAGRIGVESEPGRGSTFWVMLTLEKVALNETVPAWEGAAEPPQAAPEETLGLRVLLAEDNPINQEVACGFLELWGCTASVVSDGWQACLAARGTQFDLVLMDVQMPEMDGRQATANIRSREKGTGKHLPIIAMTAHNMQGDREQCLACGMDDYIAKPVEPAALLAALKRWGRPSQTVPASAPRATPAPAAVPALLAVPAPAAVPVIPSLPVFDRDRLHRSCAGKAALERRIISEYLRLTPSILERLHAAINAENAEGARFEAHTLKGSSRTIGAEALGEAASELEAAAKAGELTSGRTTYALIEAEWSSLRNTLEDWLKAQETL